MREPHTRTSLHCSVQKSNLQWCMNYSRLGGEGEQGMLNKEVEGKGDGKKDGTEKSCFHCFTVREGEEAIRKMAKWQTSGHKLKPKGEGSEEEEMKQEWETMRECRIENTICDYWGLKSFLPVGSIGFGIFCIPGNCNDISYFIEWMRDYLWVGMYSCIGFY